LKKKAWPCAAPSSSILKASSRPPKCIQTKSRVIFLKPCANSQLPSTPQLTRAKCAQLSGKKAQQR
jgi:hypothetical protein